MYARYGIRYPANHVDRRRNSEIQQNNATRVETVAHRSHDLGIFLRLASVLAIVCVGAVGMLQFVQ
ncbi:MAG: hypothetical protein KGI75_12365 [Rhizobiaceae bacterium]|nr:hypothetical protein [Rhizobiaceae bacterium]